MLKNVSCTIALLFIVNGGACAMGHPIGASGARIVVTLLHAMIAHGTRKGIATLYIGGGEATAVGLELMR